MPNSISDPAALSRTPEDESDMLVAVRDNATIKQDIRARAKAEGFDVVRFTSAQAATGNAGRLQAFLDAGHHGEMDWMAQRQAWRADPKSLWPDAKSVIVLGINYGPEDDPLAVLQQSDRAAISVYAQGDDYHDLVKKKLKVVAGHIFQKYKAEVKIFVDTAPVMEKPLAEKAGIGWQGKHTNLVSREFGSWLFLGSIFTTLELPADPAHENRCGHCQACLDVCPTQAFPAPYQLDARRCISYLTIENKGPIPREFRAAMGNRIYGCDDCLAVCPWNKFAKTASEMPLQARAELKAPRLTELAALDDAAFRALFRKSPVKRIGRDRFLRNVLIAIGNSRDVSLIPSAREALKEASPLVRGAAVWALSRLLPEAEFAALAANHTAAESDPQVRAEWKFKD